ncbi:hypothetical protein [Caulobacter sp. S45]|uniref:hypothetical protein n=1 Tax=Caulobacter sp. S45 TaxID=1641861 RepID=UPI00157584FC|nr:hypothetical protein [Caulobacter sp. S45]
MRRTAGRAALIGVMLGGGLLCAGISQAQDAGVQGERDAELAAAAGGPASSAHLIPYEADKAAVDMREDDVEGQQPATGSRPAPGLAAATGATPQPHPVVTAQAYPARR